MNGLTLATTQGTGSGIANLGEAIGHAVSTAMNWLDILNRPNDLLDMLVVSQEDITGRLVIGVSVIIVGLLCVFNGYRWHKWVVVILSFLVGLWVGNLLSQTMGRSMIVAVAIGLLAAIVATPLLRLTVAVFGGITGAFIGANAWSVVDAAPPDTHWAGGAIGFIMLAMASFMMFRTVVVLFTSVGGAAMVIFGGISLMMIVPEWEPALREALAKNNLIIPLLVTVGAVGSFVLQHSRVKAEPEED